MENNQMYRLAIILLALGACTQNSPSPSQKSQSEIPREFSLVYISSRGEGFNIYKNSPEGNREVQLTSDPGWEWFPQWNKEKRSLLINTQDTSGVFAMKYIDAEGNYLAYEGKSESSYKLSPKGTWGAHTEQRNDSTRLWIFPMNDPKDSLLVAKEGSYNGRPEWSPDESHVLFISDRSGSNELYIHELSSQQTRRLTKNDWREKYCSWTPDGNSVACTFAKEETPNDIYLIDIQTGVATQLTQTSINESEISWSPDGIKIAYHAQLNEKDDIFTLNIQTGEVVQITKGEGYHGEPTWIVE